MSAKPGFFNGLAVFIILVAFATLVQTSRVKKPTIEERFKRDSVDPNCYEKCIERFGIKTSYYCFYKKCYTATTTTAWPTPSYWGGWGNGPFPYYGGGGGYYGGGGKSWNNYWGKKK